MIVPEGGRVPGVVVGRNQFSLVRGLKVEEGLTDSGFQEYWKLQQFNQFPLFRREESRHYFPCSKWLEPGDKGV